MQPVPYRCVGKRRRKTVVTLTQVQNKRSGKKWKKKEDHQWIYRRSCVEGQVGLVGSSTSTGKSTAKK